MAEYGENLDFSQLLNGQHFSNLFQSEQLMIHSSEPAFHNQNNYSQEKVNNQVTTDKNINVLAPNQDTFACDPNIRMSRIDSASDIHRLNDIARQGTKDDTVKLNINFKTIFMNYFKELVMANELTLEEEQRLNEFSRRSPSFQSYTKFCSSGLKDGNISKICLEFIDSALIIQKILQSRCQMSTKKQMIKFIHVLRLNAKGNGKIYKWKDSYKK